MPCLNNNLTLWQLYTEGIFFSPTLIPLVGFFQLVSVAKINFKHFLVNGDTSICLCMDMCTCAQSCLTLWDPTSCSSPGSSVHGISQARTLGWVFISFSRESSQPRHRAWDSFISCTVRWILYHWATWESSLYRYIPIETLWTLTRQ